MTPTLGRPRGFDREAALRAALMTFWEHGFDAASVARLTGAMGITPPSLYAAFGDKKALFREVVALYQVTWGAYFGDALDEEPTAYGGIALALHRAAAAFTADAHPRGCLVISSAVHCSPDAADIADELRDIRNGNLLSIEERLRADGEPAPATRARYAGTILQGMSQQARDGATRAELEAVAALAWPPGSLV
ncbi:TetR/AcrR family transcriptional regulator [Winogradskya humida]|uniref:TetR family transcriptional regulator n=1 Tax=Winogradskya humida TaxID=113566 RepID=A0ABQ3ZXM0_9ACTN|nr:TetR/AcrR family transcriptional regulator [Actinoplanes humidus]GIE23331.1 TetR family transcriptional regulator [Actinoplanes humidus]